MIGSYLCHFSQVPLHSSFDVEAPQPLFHITHSIFQSVCSSLRYLPLLVLQPLFLFSSVVFYFLLQPPFLLYLQASPTSHEPSPYVLVDVLHFVDPQFEFLYCLFIFLLFLLLSPPSPLVYGNSSLLLVLPTLLLPLSSSFILWYACCCSSSPRCQDCFPLPRILQGFPETC